MNSSTRDNFHLTRSFFMGKKYGHDPRLIFYKRFIEPINVNRWRCLSQFNIRGFRTWVSMAAKALIKNDSETNNGLSVTIRTINDQLEHVIDFSHALFLRFSGEEFITFWEKSLNDFFKGKNKGVIEVKHLDDNTFSFSINSPNIEMEFSEKLCKFFSLKKSYQYKKTDGNVVFFLVRGFRDLFLNQVGISINFGFNDIDTKHEIIGILSCENTALADYFDKTIIDRPQKMNLKFETIRELEIRLINLVTGQVLTSIYDQTSCDLEELLITLSFSEI